LETDPPLRLVQSAPDPVGLPDHQRVLEAWLSDRAAGADRLRAPLTGEPLVLALDVMRWEEHHRLRAASSRLVLPSVARTPVSMLPLVVHDCDPLTARLQRTRPLTD